MGSFAEFAIALDTIVENLNKNNCYDLVEVPRGMGEIDPCTGLMVPVTEVQFDFPEPLRNVIVEDRIRVQVWPKLMD